MKKLEYFNISLLFLAIHLFGVHSKLLYHINPDTESIGIFSFLDMSEPNIISMLFALAYSLITVLIIKIVQIESVRIFYRFSPFLLFGILDALGVLIYYYVDMQNFQTISAIYYSLYTFCIVGGLGAYRILIDAKEMEEITTYENSENTSRILRNIMESGVFERQKNLAQAAGISESKLSKYLNSQELP